MPNKSKNRRKIAKFRDNTYLILNIYAFNHLYCEVAVRILWRDVWKFYDFGDKPYVTLSIINTLIACLPKESEEILHKNGFNITTIPIQKPPLINYASFCKVISVYRIYDMIIFTLKKQQTIISEDLGNWLLQEILKMIMNQISSLKALKCNESDFDILANYSQEYFYGLILDCSFAWSMDSIYGELEDLEELFINWQDRVSQRTFSLIIYISDNIYDTKPKKNINDIKILIEEYMKLYIKFKKFEIKKVPRYKVK
ncbi:hypothetical protein C1646_675692 [Rhizophagus diaphanus]|nr:hypothetical protein C1646_675692 [Rhizophagus diaphanus] [Rhizophagus sp. MUCL 43196]